MQLLMSRLREHCAQFDQVGSTASLSPAAGQAASSSAPSVNRNEAATLWAIVQENNRRTFFRGSGIPLEIVLLTFEYLNVADLCAVAAVNRRCNVVASFPVLWLKHCQRFSLSCTIDPSQYRPRQDSIVSENIAKKTVREYIQRARQALVETLDEERQRLRQIEERLQQRLDQAPAAPFTNELVQTAQEHQPQLVQLIQRAEHHVHHMTEQAAHFEGLRKELLTDSSHNKQTIAKLEQEILLLKRMIENPTGNALQDVEKPSRLPVGSSSSFSSKLAFRSAGTSGGAPTLNPSPISRELIEKFERKVCSVLLAPIRDLPLVIRRGTRSFSEIEMLILQIGGSSGSAPAAILNKRWNALLGMFPLRSDAYSDLVDFAWQSGSSSECPQKSLNLIPMIRKMSSWSDKELENYFA